MDCSVPFYTNTENEMYYTMALSLPQSIVACKHHNMNNSFDLLQNLICFFKTLDANNYGLSIDLLLTPKIIFKGNTLLYEFKCL